jgi:excisionase family DNA binding protein
MLAKEIKMLTVKEIAEKLKVDRMTVYRWIREGKLKATKICGIVRITEQDLADFIDGK